MKRSYKNLSKKAFSLIELSVILVLLAVIVAGGLAVTSSNVSATKSMATANKVDVIYKAMGAFLQKNYRLPCPANITLAKTSSTYGASIGSAGACSGGSGVYFNNNHAEVAYGMVPTAALGLPTSAAEDAYGNKLAYIVNVKFTKSDGYPTASSSDGFSFYSTTGDDVIQIVDQSAATVVDNVIFAIVSNGQNKFGAFNAISTAQNGTSSDTDETANYPGVTSSSTADFGVVAAQGTRVALVNASASADVFDDYVFYKTRDAMIADFSASFLVPCMAFTEYTSYTYANAFPGTLVYASSFCITPGTDKPAYSCGNNGAWTSRIVCSVY